MSIDTQMLQDGLLLITEFLNRTKAQAQALQHGYGISYAKAFLSAVHTLHMGLQADDEISAYYANQLRSPTGDQDLDTYLDSILQPDVDPALADNLTELANIAIETGATHVYLIHQPAGITLIADDTNLSQHNEPTALLALFPDHAQPGPGIQVLPFDEHNVLGG